MSEFSQERFLKIGENVFVKLMSKLDVESILASDKVSNERKIEYFKDYSLVCAGIAFSAAESFAEKFRNQEL